jgi:molybdate transport system regulatory protein
MPKPRPEVSLRFRFGQHAPVLDQRAARMLELIDAHGSIARAATAMKISYRTAWVLVAKLNECGGGSVVSASRGGSINGARLTPAGLALVDQFRRTEQELAAFLTRLDPDAPAEK